MALAVVPADTDPAAPALAIIAFDSAALAHVSIPAPAAPAYATAAPSISVADLPVALDTALPIVPPHTHPPPPAAAALAAPYLDVATSVRATETSLIAFPSVSAALAALVAVAIAAAHCLIEVVSLDEVASFSAPVQHATRADLAIVTVHATSSHGIAAFTSPSTSECAASVNHPAGKPSSSDASPHITSAAYPCAVIHAAAPAGTGALATELRSVVAALGPSRSLVSTGTAGSAPRALTIICGTGSAAAAPRGQSSECMGVAAGGRCGGVRGVGRDETRQNALCAAVDWARVHAGVQVTHLDPPGGVADHGSRSGRAVSADPLARAGQGGGMECTHDVAWRGVRHVDCGERRVWGKQKSMLCKAGMAPGRVLGDGAAYSYVPVGSERHS